MRIVILALLVLATAAVAASAVTIGSANTFAIRFLPAALVHVPHHYLFGTLSALLSVLGLAFLGRSWEREEVSERFTFVTKTWMLCVLTLAMLPAMIFLGVLIGELR